MRVLLPLCLTLTFTCLLPVNAMPTQPIELGPTANAPIPEFQWQTFAPPAGRFSVLLPAQPELRERVLTTGIIYTYICKMGDIGYVVQYDDRPSKNVRILGAEKMIMIAGDTYLRTSHSKLISKSHLTRNGYPGTKMIALRLNGKQEIICAYLAENRIYHLIAIYSAGDAEAEANANKFLNSFTLTSATPPKATR